MYTVELEVRSTTHGGNCSIGLLVLGVGILRGSCPTPWVDGRRIVALVIMRNCPTCNCSSCSKTSGPRLF